MNDPILDEIREIRLRLDKERKENPEKFYREIREIEESCKDRLVEPPHTPTHRIEWVVREPRPDYRPD